MFIKNGGPQVSLDSIVLFPFDDHSIPFQDGVKLHLQGRQGGHGNSPVLPLGETGKHDSQWIAFYGTVLNIGEEFWMWYLGQGPGSKWHQRVCLAKSKDGRNWEKPDLGLVEYQNSKHNNLVDMGEDMHVQACVIFYEPQAEDKNKRFKMAFETRKYTGLAVAYSSDGLRWIESSNNPVGGWFEMSGGAKVDGCYYLAGQGGRHGIGVRQLVTMASRDFEHWSESTCSGLRRGQHQPQSAGQGKNDGQQVHLGAALWNRGNIIIGFFGKWDGHPSNDRRMLTMDLGIAVSQDALHYREPIPNYPIVAAAEDGWSSKHRDALNLNFPALIQGQGFENIDDETLFWYGAWPEEAGDGVRVTSWPKDRLGYFSAFDSGAWSYSKKAPHFLSAPIELDGKSAVLSINIEGITKHSTITVELQDQAYRAISGYEAEVSIGPTEGGFAQIIAWNDHTLIEDLDIPFLVRVNFEGLRPEDIRIYAVYLETA